MTGLSTATLLLVTLLIPGALFIWGFERIAGRYGIGLKDRALRLMGASAVLLTLFAWPLYSGYTNYWNTFTNQETPPWYFWFFPVLYTVGPGILGISAGHAWKQDWPGVRLLIGKNRAPSAWDHLFQDRTTGGIRCKLKCGTWIAGIFDEQNGSSPYASGHPDPQELYLPTMIWIDPDTGEILTDDNHPVEFDVGVLLRGEDIQFLEFEKLPEDTNGP